MKQLLVCIGLSICILNTFHVFSNSDIVCVENPSIDPSEKEAILIIPGLGDGKKQRKHQAEIFCNQGYDVFIPDYIDKASFEATYVKFEAFHDKHQLAKYKKLHVFSYILGAWTVNSYIQKHGSQNIASIVYDRSPLQELAPQLIVENIPFIARILFGQLPEDLTKMPYPTITDTTINIGIIVESKATPILRHYETEAKAIRSFNWEAMDFHQSYNDLMYTPLNHDEMYLELPYISKDIFTFYKLGRFSVSAPRSWYNWDPFDKLPKRNKNLTKAHPEFIGKWQSEPFFDPIQNDSVINVIEFNNHASSIDYNIPISKSIENSNIGEIGVAKIDKKMQLIQIGRYGRLFMLNTAPVKFSHGSPSFVLNGITYWKQ